MYPKTQRLLKRPRCSPNLTHTTYSIYRSYDAEVSMHPVLFFYLAFLMYNSILTSCLCSNLSISYFISTTQGVKVRIVKLLQDMNLNLGVNASSDIVAYSFKLAANLPIDDKQRSELLSCSSVVKRLQMSHAILKRFQSSQELGCRRCGRTIATKTEVFTVPVYR
jgi:hypothetical protein